jgi:hypothetical protein
MSNDFDEVFDDIADIQKLRRLNEISNSVKGKPAATRPYTKADQAQDMKAFFKVFGIISAIVVVGGFGLIIALTLFN